MYKKYLLFIVSFIVTALISLNSAYAELPASLDLHYRASWGGLTIGTLTRILRKEQGNMYIVRTKVEATGLASLILRDIYIEESHFEIDGVNIFPHSYRLGPEKKPEKERLAMFDWEKKVVKLNNNRSYPLQIGIQDAATFLFSWMLNPPVDKKHGEISIVDGKRLSNFKYVVKGPRKITTIMGEFETLLVERQDENDSRKKFRMWLDVNRQHLPVKLENVRPSNSMVFELEKVEGS